MRRLVEEWYDTGETPGLSHNAHPLDAGIGAPAATTSPLRVVHVVQRLKGGGAETQVRGLCAELRRAGTDVTVVSIYDDELTAGERAGLGFPVVVIGRRGRGDLGFFIRLARELRRLRPTVVHAHLSAGKYAGRAAALLARVPAVVFTEHGDEERSPLARLASRVLHRGTRRFIVFDPAARGVFARDERVALERVVAIPNGVTPPVGDRAEIRRELGLAEDEVALWLPARLVHQKYQALALRALAALADVPGLRLFVAGEGPDAADLHALAATLELGERVAFLGFRGDAARLGCGADIFVMTSRWERMPLALGEAMLAGLAVVTTPWAGYAAFVRDGETAFVAADESVAAFAAALRRALDPGARAAVAARGARAAAERFDLGASALLHRDLYVAVAAEADRAGRRA